MNWIHTVTPCSFSVGDAVTGSRRFINSDIGINEVIPIFQLFRQNRMMIYFCYKQLKNIGISILLFYIKYREENTMQEPVIKGKGIAVSDAESAG